MEAEHIIEADGHHGEVDGLTGATPSVDSGPDEDEKAARRCRLTPEQQQLVEKNQRLVTWVMKRYGHTRVVRDLGWEDCFSAGVMGLIRAALKFDASRGVQFCTYAVWHIRGAMQDAAPYSRVVKNPHRAYRLYGGKVDDLIITHSQGCNQVDLTAELTVPSHEEGVDARLDYETYLSPLNENQRTILEESMVQSSRQIAKRMGCSYQNIDQTCLAALKTIRRKFRIRFNEENGKWLSNT